MLVALCLAPVQLQRQHEAHVPAWLLPPVLLLNLSLREGSSSMSPLESHLLFWPAVAFYAGVGTWLAMKLNDYLDGRVQ